MNVRHHPDARDPAALRAEVWERDRGKCAVCSIVAETWHADHQIPLWKAVRNDPWYWTLANLQTLCDRCHAQKTRREARERAKGKRISKRQGMRLPKLTQARKRRKAQERWKAMP